MVEIENTHADTHTDNNALTFNDLRKTDSSPFCTFQSSLWCDNLSSVIRSIRCGNSLSALAFLAFFFVYLCSHVHVRSCLIVRCSVLFSFDSFFSFFFALDLPV
jgi:hypothetical protein